MTADAEPVIRLTSLREWLQAIPYLFGFAPRESLVLLGLRGPRKRVMFQLRVDLPRDVVDAELVSDHVVDVLLRQDGVDHVLVVLYGDEPGPPTELDRALWEVLEDRMDDEGAPVDVVAAMVVRGDRWWSLDCVDPRCCPAE